MTATITVPATPALTPPAPTGATTTTTPPAATPTATSADRRGRPRNATAALLAVVVALHVSLLRAGRRLRTRLSDDRGQATTEYALVLLAAALVALLVVAWATAGGGATRVSRLFNRVVDAVIDRV